MRHSFVSAMLAELAPEFGIRLELEPEFGFVGELVLPDGRRHLFRNTYFDVNPSAASKISEDKAYTNYFLRKHGFQVPDGKTFFSDGWNQFLDGGKRRGLAQALDYAAGLGYPLFVKPNDLSQGLFVTKAHGPEDIERVAPAIWEKTNVMLVERLCPGRDYRVLVFGGEVLAAYERLPLSVLGDGVSSLGELLNASAWALKQGRGKNAELALEDPRIDMKLGRMGLSRASVPAKGARVAVLDNANLSSGGSGVDVSAALHPSFAAIACGAARALGLRLAGVDILCPDIREDAAEQGWHIIEVNSAPGMDNFAALGEGPMGRVREVYRRVLGALMELSPSAPARSPA